MLPAYCAHVDVYGYSTHFDQRYYGYYWRHVDVDPGYCHGLVLNLAPFVGDGRLFRVLDMYHMNVLHCAGVVTVRDGRSGAQSTPTHIELLRAQSGGSSAPTAITDFPL